MYESHGGDRIVEFACADKFDRASGLWTVFRMFYILTNWLPFVENAWMSGMIYRSAIKCCLLITFF